MELLSTEQSRSRGNTHLSNYYNEYSTPQKTGNTGKNLVETDECPISKKELFWTERQNNILSGLFCLLTCVTITAGVLVVYFGPQKETNSMCQLTFKRTIKSTISYDSQSKYVTIGDFNNDQQIDLAIANFGTGNVGIFLGYNNGTFANQITYSMGYKSYPTAIAIGDFNNDKNQDIAVTNYGIHNIGILFGDGRGNFSNQILISLGSSRPISLAVGDLNNDTYLDIVVVNSGTSNVIVLLGYNGGSFQAYTSYYMGYDSIPYSITLADLNNDHRLDMVIVNYGTSRLVTLIGNGNGSFISHDYSTGSGSNPCSVVSGDFNNDNQVDIAVVNFGSNNLGIFFGFGNGTFRNIITYSTGLNSRPKFLGISDFNGDKKSDIVIVNSASNNLIIFQQSNNGTFLLVTTHPIGYGSNSSSLAIGDFDNDNRSDIAITNPSTNNIFLLTQYAVLPVANLTTYSNGADSVPSFITTADFNKDTYVDILVVNGNTNTIGIFMGQANGLFGNEITYSTGDNSHPQSAAVSDINKDTQLDIIVVLAYANQVYILLGNSDGTFRSGNIYSLGDSSYPYSITLAYLNNDTYIDIVTGNILASNVAILLGNGDGTFTITTTYPTQSASNYISVATGDINNDRIVDIITANYGSQSFCILLGIGNGSFQDGQFILTGTDSPSSIVVTDLNNDKQLDIIYTAPNSYNIGILYGFGNGSFTDIKIYSTGIGTYPWSLTLGDFNNDTLLDIGVANLWDSSVGILLGYPNNTFILFKTFSTGSSSAPVSVIFTDVNNDKQLDILVANSGTNTTGILLISYIADFQNNQTYSTGSSPHPSSVAIGNFNNDSQVEIVVTNSGYDNIELLFNYDKGNSMKIVTNSLDVGSNPQFVTVGDFNQDKKLDIVTANFLKNNIAILFGNNNGTFRTQTTYSTGDQSFPNSISICDLNQDEHMDIVVTNEGTNNIAVFLGFTYPLFLRQDFIVAGTTPSPYAIVLADFNEDNLLDMAEINRYGNTIGVYLGYGNGSFAVQITLSIPPPAALTSITVADLNHDNHVDIIVGVYGHRSLGIFFSYGNGSFTTLNSWLGNPLFSPRSIATGDFNNDNNLDIVIADDDDNCLAIMFGDGQNSILGEITLPTGNSSLPSFVLADNFNHDNYLDLVVANHDVNNIGIFLGNGNGLFSEQMTYTTGGSLSPRFMAIGDLNQDNNTDVVVASEASYYIGIFFGSTNGTFSPMISYFIISQPFISSILIQDLNNDNIPDIIYTDWGFYNNYLGSIGVLFGYGNGNFAVLKTYSTGFNTYPNFVAIGDFNGDHQSDMVAADYNTDSLSIFLRSSSEPFGTPLLFSTGDQSQPKSVAIADLNNDNYLDIAVANSGTNNIGILFGYGNGMFTNQQTYSMNNNSVPISLAIGDMNQDNYSDIVVVNSQANNIVLFFGSKNGTLNLTTTYSTGISSNPVSVAMNDLNNDHYLDIVIANYGTSNILVFYGLGNGSFLTAQSYSIGYNTNPKSISIGDINNDNLLDIVVANYGGNYVELLMQTCS